MPWLGYRDLSIFDALPGIARFLQEQGAGHNDPLWSLSVEWQGSLLLFGMVALRRRHCNVWRIVLVAAFLLTIRNWFVCFLFGHLWAVRGHAGHAALGERPWNRRLLSVVCLAIGIFLLVRASAGLTWPLSILYDADIPLLSCDSAKTVVRLYGSALIFAGVSALRELHPWLERPVFRWFGPMSFPIYLTHYPVAMFVAPVVYRRLLGGSGPVVAIGVASGAFVGVTFMLARVFLAVDRMAIGRGAQLRQLLMQRL